MIKRRAPIDELSSGEMTLDAATSRYLARVLRLEEGAELTAFDPKRALEADARITKIDRGIVVIEVGELRKASIVAPRRVMLVQGVAKGEKCDAIVRDATELGVTEIVFASTERSIVKLKDARAADRMSRWEKIADEAARQCGRGDTPSVSLATWAEAIEGADTFAARFVLDPHAITPLAPHLLEATRERDHGVAFAVGPEGGLTPDEVETAEKQGWRAVSFGATVLRTETMSAAFLGALRAFGDAFTTR
jgi:16S rRNA (uracil1498-N3)-methyltransferase